MGLFPVSDQGKAHAALFGANLIYGINYSVAKVVMPEFIQPNGFILLRVSGAVLLFWLLASLYKSNEKVERKDWLRLFISALFGVATNQLLFFQGLNLTTPINAAIIMTTNPILVLVAASIMLKERIQWIKIIGIALGLGGASTLILFNSSESNLSFGTNTLLGDLFVFLNATSYALYLVTVKPLMSKYQPVTVVKYVFTFGLLMVLPFGFNDISVVQWQSFTWQATTSAIFVVVGTTFFAYLFNIYALKKVSPSTVSIYIYSQPLLASLIAIAWGKDQIDAIKLVAAALIFVGVYLVSVRKNQPK